MNVWALGGFSTIGFLVIFLNGNEGNNLWQITALGNPAYSIIALALVLVAIWAFVMAVKETKK